MAGTATAVSSTDALTSPTSSTAWEFAVPLGPEVSNCRYHLPKRASNESNSTHNKSSYRHRTPNGKPRSRNSSQTGSRRGSNTHDTYGRDTASFPSLDVGDVHNSGQFRKVDYSGITSIEPESLKSDDNWIHRDKLARIESEELQQAAMRIQRQVRTGSKSSSLRGRSHDSHSLNGNVTTPLEQTEQPWPASQRYQLESPIPFESSDEQEVETERMNWDLRRPEEIAATSVEESEDTSRFYKSPGLKKSASRIPVLASSPHTVSTDQTERESSTLQRIRTRTVGSGDEDSVPDSQSPRPSESPAVDAPEATPEPANSTTPPLSASRPSSRGGILAQTQGSPPKKTPAKPTPTARKTSVPPNSRKPSGPPKQRATSASSVNKDRPGTRSGENRPPTAVNRPEGDPPWLATMYKPDPRLPPDQQLLPTHAKRMQQEQWEKEGKTPTAYDREFAPLAVRPDDEPVLMPSEPEKKEDAPDVPSASPSTWPLQPPKSPEPVRPGTSGTNYSTMPKVQTTPPIVLSSPQRLQPNLPPEEPEKVDKGCGCCIVM